MAEGREYVAWNHTANLLAALIEPHRDEKKRKQPYTPDDFHPMVEGKRKTPPARTWTLREIREAMERGIDID